MKIGKRLLSVLLSGAMILPFAGQLSVHAAEESNQQIYDRIMSSESFNEEDYLKVQGALPYLSVKKAEGINVDGDVSDWENYSTIAMPTLPSQYQIYFDTALRDVTADLKIAYDDDYFYFVVDAQDDNHVFYTDDSTYWRGDGLQFTFSTMTDSYGSEFGMIYNSDINAADVFGFNAEQKSRVKYAGKKIGNRIIYECAVPWDIKYTEVPDKFKFSIIINDNDGSGRGYCVELAPGIAENKTNAKFPTLELASDSRKWYSFVQNAASVDMGDDMKISTFIVNSGDEEETYTISSTMDDQQEQVTVPAHSGVRYEITKVFSDVADVGTKNENIIVEDSNGNKMESACKFDIYEKAATMEQALAILEKAKKQEAELGELIEKCHQAGITTDYETAAYSTFKKFTYFIENEDIPYNDLGRMFYTERCLDDIYDNAKKSLQAYLAKEKTPFAVPKYVTSKPRVEGLSTYAMTDTNGEIAERPVFFVGYGHFDEAQKEVPNFSNFGVNNLQIELGLTNSVTNVPLFRGWYTVQTGNPVPEGYVGPDTSTKVEGDSSLKVSYTSPWKANSTFIFEQQVNVTPGHEYVLKGKAKGQNVNQCSITAKHYLDLYTFNGTFDWTDFSLTYVAPAGKTSTVVRIWCTSTTEAMWFDDLSFVDQETGEDVLINGALETEPQDTLEYNEHGVDYVAKVLQDCEDNNVSVSLLIGPHYQPDLSQVYPDMIKGDELYDMNDPRMREIEEKHIRSLITQAKDYKSLNNITLTNEPRFYPADYGDTYLPAWHEYLKEEYNEDINALNRAYGTEYTSFDEVDLYYSSNDYAKCFDANMFATQEFARWHKWMADLIREIAPGIPICTKIMGYMHDYYDGYLLKKGVWYQKYFDFLDLNGSDCENYLTRHNEPLKKEFWYEYQIGMKYVPAYNTEDHVTIDNEQYYGMEVADSVSQDIWQGAIHGRALTGIWIWQRSNVSNSFNTGFGASVLYRPDEMYKISKVAMDLNRNAYEVVSIQEEPREVGILSSDSSLLNDTTSMHALYEAFASTCYNGQKAHIIPDGQLEKMHNYKLVLVPQLTLVKKEMLTELKKYIDNGGKVVIFGKNSLKNDEHNLPNDEELVNYIYEHSESHDYTGTSSSCSVPGGEGFFKIVGDAIKAANLSYVEVRDAQTDEVVYKVESNLGVYDGKLIINIENFLEDKTVNIYVNGQKVTKAKELRDGLDFGEDITLKQYVPILLEVEVDTPFLDTYKHWSKDEVASLAKTGIINGVSASRFAPDASITRAEFLALLMRASKFDTVAYNGEIADVANDAWYAENVATALANGVIDNGSFRPEDKITREEMCTMLVRAYEKLHGEMSTGTVSFIDSANIGDISSVSKAVAKNIFKGMDDGSFAPKANSTRAEAAAVIQRFISQ